MNMQKEKTFFEILFQSAKKQGRKCVPAFYP